MALLLSATAALLPADEMEPLGLLLTWKEDPTTTMVIDWHTGPDHEWPEGQLRYRPEGGDDWNEASGETFDFPFADWRPEPEGAEEGAEAPEPPPAVAAGRKIHRIELTGLDPDTRYEFRFGEENAGESYVFRTMPADTSRPIRIAAGGDVMHREEWMTRTNEQAGKYDVDFFLWGGDLAYGNGRPDAVERWVTFFDTLKALRAEDGRLIPVVAAIGNHEVRGAFYFRMEDYEDSDEWREEYAPYFYRLFAFPGHPGHNVLDFGDYLSLIALDTDHTHPIEGQVEWLRQVLEERRDVPHVIPYYHVPGFPSHRPFDGIISQKVREHWVPLFDEYEVRVAFENHDHTYKRTPPIRHGEIHPRGVVYIGDGAWGVGTRTVHPADETWYLARSESLRHLIITTLHGTHQHFLMINEDGEVIDEYPETPRPQNGVSGD